MSEHRTETKTPEIYCVTFGSTSDENNILPGIKQFTDRYPEIRIVVQYASADNTPEKAGAILSRLSPKDHGYEGVFFINGAGMSNVLTGVCKAQYARLQDLVIGVPIADNSSAGLTAFLSTVEKPPYNPVFTVGLNNTDAALEIAYRFMHRASVEEAETVGIPEQTRRFLPDFCLKLEEVLNEFNIPFSYRDQSALESDGGVVISPLSQGVCPLLKKFDRAIAGSGGIQIVYSVDLIYADVSFYERIMREMGGMSCTGMTTSLFPVNAAIVAAQLIRNKHAIQLIEEKRQTRVEKLNQHPGFVMVNGEIEN
ncbi:MAG: AIR carboxylase family protein [Candidatus Pacearchaeota archaeon]|nr:AIR carboxylase family protein [Candidatus Pacearchaeota archaeon]